VIQLGIASAVALFVAAFAIRKIKDSVVNGISNAAGRSAARQIFDSMISSLRGLIWWIVAIAVVAAIVAYLIGRPTWLTKSIAWLRRSAAERPGGSKLDHWVAAHADALRIGGVVLAIVVLLIVGFGWISFLVIAALLALFLWAVETLRRRGAPLEEIPAPDGGTPTPDGGPDATQADLKTEETVVAGANTEEIQTGT
jgi:type III secretory pathway component EscV